MTFTPDRDDNRVKESGRARPENCTALTGFPHLSWTLLLDLACRMRIASDVYCATLDAPKCITYSISMQGRL